MVETRPDEAGMTLPALLAARARAASDARLALDAAGGLLAGSFALAVRPPAWPLLVAAATCLFAYGAWGIADRAVREHPTGERGARVLRVLRAGTALLGVLGVVALGGVVMAFALGNWIH